MNNATTYASTDIMTVNHKNKLENYENKIRKYMLKIEQLNQYNQLNKIDDLTGGTLCNPNAQTGCFLLSPVIHGISVFKSEPDRVDPDLANVNDVAKLFLDEITRVGYSISLIESKPSLTIESITYEVQGFTRIADTHCVLLLFNARSNSYNLLTVGPAVPGSASSDPGRRGSASSDPGRQGSASSTNPTLSYVGTLNSTTNINLSVDFIQDLINKFQMNSTNKLMYPILHFHDRVNNKPMYRKVLIKKFKDANILECYEITNPDEIFVKNAIPMYINISDIKSNLTYYDKLYGIISVRKFDALDTNILSGYVPRPIKLNEQIVDSEGGDGSNGSNGSNRSNVLSRSKKTTTDPTISTIPPSNKADTAPKGMFGSISSFFGSVPKVSSVSSVKTSDSSVSSVKTSDSSVSSVKTSDSASKPSDSISTPSTDLHIPTKKTDSPIKPTTTTTIPLDSPSRTNRTDISSNPPPHVIINPTITIPSSLTSLTSGSSRTKTSSSSTKEPDGISNTISSDSSSTTTDRRTDRADRADRRADRSNKYDIVPPKMK